jgi:hypothetical protein
MGLLSRVPGVAGHQKGLAAFLATGAVFLFVAAIVLGLF